MPDNYAYSKRPLWQWLLIYIILGAVIYGLVYYFVFAKRGGYTYPTTQQTSSPTQAASPSGNIYLTKTDATKGVYLTDFSGMTLYTFDKDTTGVSNCSGACLALWPAYTSGATMQKTFPANISVITRSDGSKQFAWKGMPLYYYASDRKPGDLLGDGLNNLWHIVKP